MEIKFYTEVNVYLFTQSHKDTTTGQMVIDFVQVYPSKKEALNAMDAVTYRNRKDGEAFDAGALGTAYQYHQENELDFNDIDTYEWETRIEYPDHDNGLEIVRVVEKTF